MADVEETMIADAALPVAASEPVAGAVVVKPKGNPFLPGHPRYGGRQKGTKNKRAKPAQEMAAAMDADPVKFMLTMLVSDSMSGVAIDPATGKVRVDEKGKPIKVFYAITPEMKLDAAKNVAKYIHPAISAVQVTGANDGPVAVTALDVGAILANPQLAAAAQELALMVVDAEQAAEND